MPVNDLNQNVNIIMYNSLYNSQLRTITLDIENTAHGIKLYTVIIKRKKTYVAYPVDFL